MGLKSYQLMTVLFAFGSLMSLGWLDNARGPIYPLIVDDLSLTHSQGSLFFALASFMAVGANFLVPFLLRFLNSLQLLLAGILILASFPLVLSQSFSFPILLTSAVLFGLALGIIAVTQNIVVEENVPVDKKRIFLSLLHSTYGLSALLAPLLVAVILDRGFKWNESLNFSLLFIFPIMILGLFSILKNKQNIHQLDLNILDLPAINLNQGVLTFWGFLLAFYVSSELFFTTRLVLILKDYFGHSLQESTYHLVLFFLGLFIGRILVSFAPKWLTGKSLLVSSFVLCSFWIIFSFLYFPTKLFLVGFFMSPVYPIAMDEISNQVGKEFKRYSSLIIAFSSIGVVIMHMLVGYISDTWGLNWAIVLPTTLCFFAILLCLMFWPNKVN